jgi:hypothetical protein
MTGHLAACVSAPKRDPSHILAQVIVLALTSDSWVPIGADEDPNSCSNLVASLSWLAENSSGSRFDAD